MSLKRRKDESSKWPKEALVSLEKGFQDERGIIQPLVEAEMRSALMISSKKGTVRGNHYHLSDWHYCYVVSGVIEYHFRPSDSKEPPECIFVEAGQMFFTPPMVEHAMRFPEDTSFLTLSRNPRDQNAYETDLVRVNLI